MLVSLLSFWAIKQSYICRLDISTWKVNDAPISNQIPQRHHILSQTWLDHSMSSIIKLHIPTLPIKYLSTPQHSKISYFQSISLLPGAMSKTKPTQVPWTSPGFPSSLPSIDTFPRLHITLTHQATSLCHTPCSLDKLRNFTEAFFTYI